MRSWTAAAVAALIMLVSATAASAAATPELGSSPDWHSVDGAVPYGSGHAVPLKAATPAWFTDELAARVDAANGAPVAAPSDAPLPGEIGIRPGSWMIAPAGCTMNFVFGSPGGYSIGTAGHCGKNGRGRVLLTLAPGGANPVLVELGTVQKSVDGGIGNDFALVSIRPELQKPGEPDDRRRGRPLRLLHRVGTGAGLPLRARPGGGHRRHAAGGSRPEVGEQRPAGQERRRRATPAARCA